MKDFNGEINHYDGDIKNYIALAVKEPLPLRKRFFDWHGGFLKSRTARSGVVRGFCLFSAVGSALLAGGIVLFVAFFGFQAFNKGFFSFHYTSDNCSVLPSLINTTIMLLLSVTLGGFLGIASAIFINEYAASGSALVRAVVISITTLGGIPSIVYGIVGFLIFSVALGMRYCLLSGALTLAVMITPVVMRAALESLKAVPGTLRDASLSLGAGKFWTLTHTTLPVARRSLFNALILSAGRVSAESAALLYTAGTVPQVSKGLFSSGRTMAVHLYCLWSEGLSEEASYGVALFLILFCLLFNLLSRVFFSREK